MSPVNSINDNISIEEAREKMRKAKAKIDERHKAADKKEPDLLISGHFDELELKRRDKGLSDDE